MRVYRYMSMTEFNKMSMGMDMINNKNHSITCNSTSKGFCFLGGNANDATFAIRFLSGIVSSDILVEFYTTEASLIPSVGIYANPYSNNWDDNILVDEFCCKTYNKKSFHPLRYCFVGDLDKNHQQIWYNFN